MPITWRTPVSVTAASGAGFTMPVSAGTTDGDFLVAVVANAGTTGPAAPAGWSRDYSASAGSGQCCSVFTAPYSAGLTRSFTNAASAAVAVCGAYYQASANVMLDGAPVAVTNTTNNTTLPTGAPATGAFAGDFEVLAYAHTAAPTVTTTASGSTVDLRAANGTSCTAILGHNNTTSLAASTTCTAFSHTLSASNNRKTGVGILLRAVTLRNLTGSSSGVATAVGTASIRVFKNMTAATGGAAGVNATLTGIRSLTGAAPGAASTTAQVNLRRLIDGVAAGSSTTAAAINQRRAVTGASSGSSSTSAALTLRRAVSGSSVGTSTAQATAGRKRSLVGTAAGATTVAVIFGIPTDEYGLAVYNYASNIAYWRLGETSGTAARDSSKTGGHHGTYTGGVLLGQPSALSSGADASPSFDGVNDYVSIPDFALTGSFTVEAWYKADVIGPAHHIVVERRTTGNLGGFVLWVGATGIVSFQLYSTAWNTLSSTRALAAGVWHHLVGVYHSSGSSLLMVNGEDVGRGSGWGTLNNPAAALFRIGADYQGGGPADGQIDEVALYSTNIPDAVIQQHYFLGVKARDSYESAIQRTPGLVAHWALDEPFGANCFDSTGRGQTLTAGAGAVITGAGSGIPGVARYSRYFDTTVNAKLTRPIVDPALNFGSGSFSLEFWSLQNTPTVGPIIEYGDANNWGLHIWSYPGSGDGVWINAPGWAGLQTSLTMTGGGWHHVVIERDVNTVRAYIDGSLSGTLDVTGLANGTIYPFNVSYRPVGEPDTTRTGYIDQVAAYNVALTPTQIVEHYDRGRGLAWKVSLTGSAAGSAAVAAAPSRRRSLQATAIGRALAFTRIPTVRFNSSAILGHPTTLLGSTVLGAQPATVAPPLDPVSSAGKATTSATITAYRALLATSSGVATVATALSRRRALAATSAGAAATTAVITARRALAGVSGGAATTAGQAARRRALTASAAGVATTSGTPAALRNLAASAAGRATVAATPTRRRSLLATSSGVASVAVALTRRRALSGLSAGASTAGAVVKARRGILGASSAGKAITNAGFLRGALYGNSVGRTTITASASARRALQASSVGKATTGVLLGRLRSLSAASAGRAIATAVVGRKIGLLGASAGQATTASINFLRYLAASPAVGQATTSTVVITVWRQLQGAAIGSSTASITAIEVKRSLVGLSEGRASVAGVVQAYPTLPSVITYPQLPPWGTSGSMPAYPHMGVTDDSGMPAVSGGIATISAPIRSGTAVAELTPSSRPGAAAADGHAQSGVSSTAILPPPQGTSSSTLAYPGVGVTDGAATALPAGSTITTAENRASSATAILEPPPPSGTARSR